MPVRKLVAMLAAPVSGLPIAIVGAIPRKVVVSTMKPCACNK